MKTIDFTGKRHIAFVVSLILLVIALVSFFYQGLNLGIDFTGGSLIEVRYQKSADLNEIRAQLSDGGFPDASVQFFGSDTDVLVRLAPRAISSAALSAQVFNVLNTEGNEVAMRRVEFVGPKVGDELTTDGALSVLYALIGILIYVAMRFEYRFALGSIVALAHDVLITVGIFSILQLEFDLSVLAAVLAVIGYSLNDTIVVFDRIRENFVTERERAPEATINHSINQTLARTLTTSGTTLLVLFTLFFLGGEGIRSFSTALLIGVVVGTYSSIYVASPVLIALGVSKKDLMPSEKEQKIIRSRP